MTLKEAIYESSHDVTGMDYILHRKYYDDRWNGERDGYMEISIVDYIKGESNDDALIKIQIRTAFQDHHPDDTEWHDMSWCSHWDVISTHCIL